jgi:hypothetical protein
MKNVQFEKRILEKKRYLKILKLSSFSTAKAVPNSHFVLMPFRISRDFPEGD